MHGPIRKDIIIGKSITCENDVGTIKNNLETAKQRSAEDARKLKHHLRKRCKDKNTCQSNCRTCRKNIYWQTIDDYKSHSTRTLTNRTYSGYRQTQNNDEVSAASTIRNINAPNQPDILAEICSIKHRFRTASNEYINQYVKCWTGTETNQHELDSFHYKVHTPSIERKKKVATPNRAVQPKKQRLNNP
jgi:hypothetical protein